VLANGWQIIPERGVVRPREPFLLGTNHMSGTADRLRCCQIRWTVSGGKMMNVIGHQFIVLTVDICGQQSGSEAPRRAGLSGAAETCFCRHNITQHNDERNDQCLLCGLHSTSPMVPNYKNS